VAEWLRGRLTDLDTAALTCERALDTLVTAGGPPPAAGPGYVGLADIAYQRDDLDLALRYAAEGIALCRQFVYTPRWPTAWPR